MAQTESTRENSAGSVTAKCFVFEGLNNGPAARHIGSPPSRQI